MSAGLMTEIVMPRMGLTMEEGTILAWLKQPGELVQAGEILLEIETDKASVEIEAPTSGVLSQVIGQPGEVFPIGAVIGYLAPEGVQATQPTKTVTLDDHQEKPSTIKEYSDKVRASPAARHLARTQGINLSQIQGSGPSGRVVAWNVRQAMQQSSIHAAAESKVSPLAQRVAGTLGIDPSLVSGSGPGGRVMRKDIESTTGHPTSHREEKKSVLPLPGTDFYPATRQQQIMAERMVSSFRQAPHFYLHVEVDARRLTALRHNLLPILEKRFDVHLTFTDLLVKFLALTLPKHPRLLAQWVDEKGYQQFQHANIGLAMDTPHGLIVPVIFNADQLSLVEIARQRTDLASRAQNGKLTPHELELGVITLTNLGMFGVDSFNAILNPPQAAILAVGRIKERPLAVDGELIAAPTLKLSLSVDHRVLDGATAARFLGELAELLENPDLVLV